MFFDRHSTPSSAPPASRARGSRLPALALVAVLAGALPWFLPSLPGPVRAILSGTALLLAVLALAGPRFRKRPHEPSDRNARPPTPGTVDFQSLFASAEDAILILEGYRCVDCNASAVALFGYDRSSMVGSTMAELAPEVQPDGRRSAEVWGDHLAAAYRGAPQSFERTGRRRNGDEFPAEVRMNLVAASDGTFLWVIVRDITERRRAEEALRASEARYRAVVENQTEFIVRWKPDGTRTFANEAYLRCFGLTPEQATGSNFLPLVAEADRPAILAKMARLVSGAVDSESEVHRSLRPDGSVVWQEWTDTVLRDPAGRVVELLSVGRDITDRTLAELRVQRLSRTREVMSEVYQTIVREPDSAAMLAAACRIAVEQGKFRMAWLGMVEAESGQVVPVASAGVVDGYLDALQIDLTAPGWSSGPTAVAARTGRPAVCNDIANDPAFAPWRDEALERGYRSSAAFPVLINGGFAGCLNLYAPEPHFFDAEEQRLLAELATNIGFALEVGRRELALKDQEQMVSAIVESSQDWIWAMDLAGRHTYSNRAVERILGYPPAEFQGTGLDLVHPEDRRLVEERWPAWVEERTGWANVVLRWRARDGSYRFLESTAVPILSAQGALVGFRGVDRDITERRLLEQQLRQSQKLEAIGQLAGGVAHDFNNLLTVILGNLQLAMTEPGVKGGMRDHLDQAINAAENATGLTRQLLLFSRKQAMQPQPLDLNEVVTRLTRMLRRIIGEDVRLELRLHPTPPTAMADAGMLDQLLMNLVVNARDAMPTGGHLVIATSERVVTEAEALAVTDASPGVRVCLEVTDDGSGIAPEVLPRLFEPFFTTKEPGRGTGLGLATVFGIVKQHGGWITVDTAVGQGTTFRVFLPAVDSVQAPLRVVAPEVAHGGETILLVEDDASVRRVLHAALTQHGYVVVDARHGAEALERWDQRGGAIHLLFTDVVMPGGMSGYELAARLRERRPRLKVVFNSGYSPEAVQRAATPDGGQEFLQKPASLATLLETVRRCLDS